MNMQAINQYALYCNTEQCPVYVWTDTPPTKCPNNTNHVINPDSVYINQTISTNPVVIQNELTSTGKHYNCKSVSFDIQPNSTNTKTISFKFPVTILSVFSSTGTDQKGDLISFFIAKNKTTGTVTSDILETDTVLPVSPTVIQYINIGYLINITDGTTSSQLLLVVDIDEKNGTVTLENPIGLTFNTGSYVQMSIAYGYNVEISNPGVMRFGSAKIYTGSYLPANTEITIEYTNKGTSVSHPVIYLEYFY